MFSGDLFQKRLDSNYVSQSVKYFGEWLSVISEIGKIRPFWVL